MVDLDEMKTIRRTIEIGDTVLWRANPRSIFGDTRRGVARDIERGMVSVEFANCARWLPADMLERLPSFDEAFSDKPSETHDDDWYAGPVDEGDSDEWPYD